MLLRTPAAPRPAWPPWLPPHCRGSPPAASVPPPLPAQAHTRVQHRVIAGAMAALHACHFSAAVSTCSCARDVLQRLAVVMQQGSRLQHRGTHMPVSGGSTQTKGQGTRPRACTQPPNLTACTQPSSLTTCGHRQKGRAHAHVRAHQRSCHQSLWAKD